MADGEAMHLQGDTISVQLAMTARAMCHPLLCSLALRDGIVLTGSLALTVLSFEEHVPCFSSRGWQHVICPALPVKQKGVTVQSSHHSHTGRLGLAACLLQTGGRDSAIGCDCQCWLTGENAGGTLQLCQSCS